VPFSPLIPARTLDADQQSINQVPAEAVMAPGCRVQVACMVPIVREHMPGAISVDGQDRWL
jgi:hypothetical protein